MTVAVALLLVVLGTVHARRRRGALDTGGGAEAWPCVVARAASGARPADRHIAARALDALAQGPPGARAAVRHARRTHGPRASAARRLAVACDRLGSARSDRLHAVTVVAGTAAPFVLTALWRSEVDDIAHHDDRAALARTAHAGRWLLLAPLAPIAVGAVGGVAAVLLAGVAVLAWFAAGVWIDAAGPRRLARCAPTAHLASPAASTRA
ncbi:MAG TPA: hypothetical protein VFZ70_06205 [Euzebyales bacterium]